jgi:branched-chain amino acid transport system permease protein
MKGNFGYILLPLFVAMFPVLFKNDYYISVGIFVAIYLIILLGLNVLLGYAGVISLGHAAFYAIGAYSSAIFTLKFQCSPALTLPLVLILTCAIAFLIGYPTLKLRGYYIALATLVFGELTQVVISEFKILTGGTSGLGSIPKLSAMGIVLDSEVKCYYAIWISTLFLVYFTQNILRSSSGRILKAISIDEDASNELGIDTAKFKMKAFIYSACLAAIAGFFYAHYMTFISPQNFGMMESFILVIVLIVGGKDFVLGSVVGSLLIVVLPETLHEVVDFSVLIYGCVLLFFLYFMPRGIIGHAVSFYGTHVVHQRKNSGISR